MKKLKFSTSTSDIKEESLHKLIDAAIGCQSITRAQLSRASAVSLTTAGKLLSAMDSCGFTHLAFDRSGARDGHEKLHVLSPDLSTLILDFSTQKYLASIIFNRGERIVRKEHNYDSSISFENNLILFFSAVGKEISALPYFVSSVCAVTADEKNPYDTTDYIPQNSDLGIIDELCLKFFKLSPTLHLTLSESIRCAVKYGIFNNEIRGDISYIKFKDSISAFYLPQKKSSIRFCTEKLMLDNGDSFESLFKESQISRHTAKIITRIINLMDCAYPTDCFLIEYDRDLFGKDLPRLISLTYSAAEKSLPFVKYWENTASITELGASCASLAELIKAHIHGVK